MVWRQYDWECDLCEYPHTDLVEVATGEEVPRYYRLDCPSCGADTVHRRIMSAPAQYMYDRPYAPIVKGGRFDTAGNRKPPPLPELPADASMDKARDLFASKDYKERKRERFAVAQENAQKRARLKAMKKHPTMDLRNTPLPGDPKLS